jgi:ATP-dependent DNA helicase RecG
VKILETLQQNPNYSIPEIAVQIAKSVSATERAIRRLKGQGRIRRIGPDKGGHWEVVEKKDDR